MRNLIYYLNAFCAISYLKSMGSGIQAFDKTNEFLSVMTVCRNTFHNGNMAYTCYKFMTVLPTEFLWHVQFSWKQCFHALISNLMTATWLPRF